MTGRQLQGQHDTPWTPSRRWVATVLCTALLLPHALVPTAAAQTPLEAAAALSTAPTLAERPTSATSTPQTSSYPLGTATRTLEPQQLLAPAQTTRPTDPAGIAGSHDTNSCPQAVWPPAPIDESEAAAPDQLITPLAVPEPPIGGEQLSTCTVVMTPGFALPSDVLSASAWIVADLDTGEILATKDPHGRYRPASIIKLLLALVVVDHASLDDEVIADPDSVGAEGSRTGIGVGGRYTVRQLLSGLVMASGNDTAALLAEHLGGHEHTLELMNAKAQEIGALDTRAASVSGLDAAGMSTSAYDQVLILQHLTAVPELAEILAATRVDFPGFPTNAADPDGEQRPGFELWSDVRSLHEYEGAFAGKTGFTDDARHTYSVAAERDGRRLGVIVLDATVSATVRASHQAEALLDAGFARLATADADPITPVGMLVDEDYVAERTRHSFALPVPTLGDFADREPPDFSGVNWAGAPLVGAVAAGIIALAVLSMSLTRKLALAREEKRSARRRGQPTVTGKR